MRHRDSHKLKSHQLGVRVEGWQPIIPVTVDRVGIYFRQAFPELKTYGELMVSPQLPFQLLNSSILMEFFD